MKASSAHAPGQRYFAFISYSHKDKKWASWLRKQLEGYRVPAALARQLGSGGLPVKKIYPVFRDREELPSSSSLSTAIRDALSRSKTLIVVCSPRSAQSRWVNEEVRLFKQMGRTDRVLCVIVDGEPNVADKVGGQALECFVPALRHEVDEEGRQTTGRSEPIAADLRPGGDTKRAAVLKLVAGILGVSYGLLNDRDKAMRTRKGLAAAAVILALILAGAGLWISTERRRLTDLSAEHTKTLAASASQMEAYAGQLLSTGKVPEAMTVMGERARPEYPPMDEEQKLRLRFWLPRLVPLDALLNEASEDFLFTWRHTAYLHGQEKPIRPVPDCRQPGLYCLDPRAGILLAVENEAALKARKIDSLDIFYQIPIPGQAQWMTNTCQNFVYLVWGEENSSWSGFRQDFFACCDPVKGMHEIFTDAVDSVKIDTGLTVLVGENTWGEDCDSDQALGLEFRENGKLARLDGPPADADLIPIDELFDCGRVKCSSWLGDSLLGFATELGFPALASETEFWELASRSRLDRLRDLAASLAKLSPAMEDAETAAGRWMDRFLEKENHGLSLFIPPGFWQILDRKWSAARADAGDAHVDNAEDALKEGDPSGVAPAERDDDPDLAEGRLVVNRGPGGLHGLDVTLHNIQGLAFLSVADKGGTCHFAYFVELDGLDAVRWNTGKKFCGDEKGPLGLSADGDLCMFSRFQKPSRHPPSFAFSVFDFRTMEFLEADILPSGWGPDANGFAFSPDSRYLFILTENDGLSVYEVDRESGRLVLAQVLQLPHAEEFERHWSRLDWEPGMGPAVFYGNGRFLFLVTGDGNVHALDWKTGFLAWTLKNPLGLDEQALEAVTSQGAPPVCAAVDPTGVMVALYGWDRLSLHLLSDGTPLSDLVRLQELPGAPGDDFDADGDPGDSERIQKVRIAQDGSVALETGSRCLLRRPPAPWAEVESSLGDISRLTGMAMENGKPRPLSRLPGTVSEPLSGAAQ